MAVCKRCGCAIPIGQKNCDICEPRIASASAQASTWQPQREQPWQPQTYSVTQPPAYQASAPASPQPQAYAVPQGIMPASELASSAQAWAGRAGGMQLTAETAPKAGFWMRFLALLIDSVCIGIPGYAIGRVLLHGDTATYYGVSLIIELCYFMYFWSSYGKGQTIGMQLLHMKVVKTDGSLLSLTGALVRFVGYVISGIALDLGFIWAAFDRNKQGWHDKIAGTYVISNW